VFLLCSNKMLHIKLIRHYSGEYNPIITVVVIKLIPKHSYCIALAFCGPRTGIAVEKAPRIFAIPFGNQTQTGQQQSSVQRRRRNATPSSHRSATSLPCLLPIPCAPRAFAAAGAGDMSGAAVKPRSASAAAASAAPPATAITKPQEAPVRGGGGECGGPARVAATLEHVLLVLRETEAEREARIRGVFGFDAAGRGHLDHAQIEAGLAVLRVPEGSGAGSGAGAEDYARALLRPCDRDRDGRVGYDDFRSYMDDKELELYRIFQAIDVEHNGCILPEELSHALVKAGNSNAAPLASFHHVLPLV
jgi:hypothetical protein